MAVQTECELAADPAAPAAARHFVKSALEKLLRSSPPASFYDDVQLVISELVTNAVRAGSPRIGISLGLKGKHILLQVTDHAVGWPEQRETGLAEPGGRGLPLVNALSASWGVRAARSGSNGDPTGKVVWAELPVPTG